KQTRLRLTPGHHGARRKLPGTNSGQRTSPRASCATAGLAPLRDQSEGPRVAFGEGGVGVSRAVPDRARLLTLERPPVIADAFLFAVRTSDRRLDPALDPRAASAGAGANGGAGK